MRETASRCTLPGKADFAVPLIMVLDRLQTVFLGNAMYRVYSQVLRDVNYYLMFWMQRHSRSTGCCMVRYVGQVEQGSNGGGGGSPF